MGGFFSRDQPFLPNRIHQDRLLNHFLHGNDVVNDLSQVPPFVKIVSARANFEAVFPRDTICWKAAAFAHEIHSIQRFGNVVLRNILSFGDSLDEQTAVKINAIQLNSRSKSVKFLDNPTFSQLFRQLEVMVEYLPWISENQQDLDVLLTVQDENPIRGTETVQTEAHQFNQQSSISSEQMTVIDN